MLWLRCVYDILWTLSEKIDMKYILDCMGKEFVLTMKTISYKTRGDNILLKVKLFKDRLKMMMWMYGKLIVLETFEVVKTTIKKRYDTQHKNQ